MLLDSTSYWWIVLQVASLPLLVWLTYYDVLQGYYVSDDIAGMAMYDGKLHWAKSHDCAECRERKCKQTQPLTLGLITKKLRYEFGKVPNPNRGWKQQKLPPFLPNHKIHHRLNLWMLCGIGGLLYGFLSRVIDPQIAYLATALFLVHPLGVQVVGWISGVPYLFGALFMLLGLNSIYLMQDASWMLTSYGTLAALGLYGLLAWLAVENMFAMIGATVLLIFLHLWPFAVLSGLMAIYTGLNAFRAAIDLRKQTFKDQKMEASIELRPSRILVVLKSLAYYTSLVLWPKRMGLYHTYLYHYEMPYVESEDRNVLIGLGLVGLYTFLLWSGPFTVQLSLMWFLSFLWIFLNWIIANQIFTERYAWLPALGACLLISAYAPLWLWGIIFGLALMRTWMHLPTYYNETQFYMSNLWNFPASEISMGNLGVVYLGRGLISSAMETFILGAKMNPEYDVNWYNLSTIFKSRGPVNPNYVPAMSDILPKEVLTAATSIPTKMHLIISHYCLDRALKSRTCHFPDLWNKELAELANVLATEPNPVYVGTQGAALPSPVVIASTAAIVGTNLKP